MRTPQEVWDDSTEGAPFSNSTMGEMWMDRWCYLGCIHEPDCPLLLVALSNRTPAEWRKIGDTGYHCIEYRDTPDQELIND